MRCVKVERSRVGPGTAWGWGSVRQIKVQASAAHPWFHCFFKQGTARSNLLRTDATCWLAVGFFVSAASRTFQEYPGNACGDDRGRPSVGPQKPLWMWFQNKRSGDEISGVQFSPGQAEPLLRDR